MAYFLIITTLFSGIASSGSLALARVAERRELRPADVEEPGLLGQGE